MTGEEEALDKEVAQTPTLERVAGGSRSANKQGLGSQGEADTEERRGFTTYNPALPHVVRRQGQLRRTGWGLQQCLSNFLSTANHLGILVKADSDSVGPSRGETQASVQGPRLPLARGPHL